MCHETCSDFVRRNVRAEDVEGKNVLEVGSRNVNGSTRGFIESMHPDRFIGLDIVPGTDVDVLCRAENLVKHFGKEKFDLVIATEVIEHVRNWRVVVNNIKQVLKPGGIVVITTRSKGFPYHPYPRDYWRYEPEDVKTIFSDFQIEEFLPDNIPGVFVRAKKPLNYFPANMDSIQLYCMIKHRPVQQVTLLDDIIWSVEWFIRRVLGRLFPDKKSFYTDFI